MNSSDGILLVGPGKIGIEYGRILKDLGYHMIVVGRGKKSANNFKKNLNISVHLGGIDNWLKNHSIIPEYAIVAVNGTQLGNVCLKLINKGVKNILLEKPGGIDFNEIKEVASEAKNKDANVLIAYNRRFFSSVIKAKEIINDDGGVKSFHFEFTEWAHQIKDLNKPILVKKNWFLHNSTHVVDMAFYLCSEPKKIYSLKGGKLDWHPDGSIFVGAGITEKNSLFSYHSNWTSPGRWSLEVLTNNKRLIFKPLEKLKCQKIGYLEINNIDLKNKYDLKFKPGFYLQVKNFLEGKWINMMNIHDQVKRLNIYEKILKP